MSPTLSLTCPNAVHATCTGSRSSHGSSLGSLATKLRPNSPHSPSDWPSPILQPTKAITSALNKPGLRCLRATNRLSCSSRGALRRCAARPLHCLRQRRQSACSPRLLDGSVRWRFAWRWEQRACASFARWFSSPCCWRWEAAYLASCYRCGQRRRCPPSAFPLQFRSTLR